jgi:hypothetical protein
VQPQADLSPQEKGQLGAYTKFLLCVDAATAPARSILFRLLAHALRARSPSVAARMPEAKWGVSHGEHADPSLAPTTTLERERSR